MRLSRGVVVVMQVLVALATGVALPAGLRRDLRNVQRCLTSRMYFAVSPVSLMMAVLIVIYPFSLGSVNPLPVDEFLQIGTVVLVAVVWLSIILLNLAVSLVQVAPLECFNKPEPLRLFALHSACFPPAERPPMSSSERGGYAI